MWIHASRAQSILRKLLPELPNVASSLELSSVVNVVYEKYFKDKVNFSQQNLMAPLQLDVRTNQLTPPQPSIDDVWIFGYGSLVWKADFPYIDRRRGYINGYQRRFYQHSIDHRGTASKPGRVVTLLPTGLHEDRVYGVAYRIAGVHKESVLKHLDYREKNGYERCELAFQEFPDTQNIHFDVIMYVACHSNDSYAGEVWQIPRIAEQIFTSAGPSGPNRDYLFNLAVTMRELFPGVQDTHLYELEKEVKYLIETVEQATLEQALKQRIEHILTEIATHSETAIGADDQPETIFESLHNECDAPGWRERLLTQALLSTANS